MYKITCHLFTLVQLRKKRKLSFHFSETSYNSSFLFVFDSSVGFLHSTANHYRLIWPVVSGMFSVEMEKNFCSGQD